MCRKWIVLWRFLKVYLLINEKPYFTSKIRSYQIEVGEKKVYLKNLNYFHLATLLQNKKFMLTLISLQINHLQETTLIFPVLGRRQGFNFLPTFKLPNFHCSYTHDEKEIQKRNEISAKTCASKSETWTWSNRERSRKSSWRFRARTLVFQKQ